MGNNQSQNSAKPASGSPGSATAGAVHGSNSSSSKREPRLPHNPNHRVAAPPEPSLAQARGSTVPAGHRSTHSQSRPIGPFDIHSSPSPNSPSHAEHQARSIKNDGKNEPSKPVAVPAHNIESSSLRSQQSQTEDIEPRAPPQDMSYNLTRPPRLPLPIEQEVHTPGSPFVAPADADAPVLDPEIIEEGLGRASSTISSGSVDEDDDDAELLIIDRTKANVPTVFEWLRGGDKVYVTGTIFQWSKKFRLHPVEGRPGVFSATIPVLPGTHHVRFIVDGNMTLSRDLPTTVDFGNNLVNYIEVNPDDVPQQHSSQVSDAGSATPSNPDPESKPPPARTKPVLADQYYTNQMPRYLVDIERQEGTPEYQYASAIVEKLPTPPSLPGFLGKPILNATTPMKDDNSVLNMPNHTVLNHLATSSIRNNVLAVSGTTRYKKKYVTTIMYTPTADD